MGSQVTRAATSLLVAVGVASVTSAVLAFAGSPQRFTAAVGEAIRRRRDEGQESDATPELRARIAREVDGMLSVQPRLERELTAAAKHGWGVHFGPADPGDARLLPWAITVTTDSGVTIQPFELDEAFPPRVDDVAVATWTANAGYLPTVVAFPRTPGEGRRAFVGVRRVQFRPLPSAEGVWPNEVARGVIVQLQGTTVSVVGTSRFARPSEIVGKPSHHGVEIISYGPYFDVIRAQDEACFDSGSAAYLVRGPGVLAFVEPDGRVVTNTERARRFVVRQCDTASGVMRKRRGWLSDIAFELACRRLLGESTATLLVEIVEPELRRRRCVDSSFLREWAAMPTLSDG